MTRNILVALVMIAIGVMPLISVLVAGLIADHFDCDLHEGFVQSCMAYGRDIGGVLHTMLSLGWLMLVSLLFLAAGVLGLIGELLRYAARRIGAAWAGRR